jgi:hypothetical protein
MDSNLVWFILINPLIAAVLVHACSAQVAWNLRCCIGAVLSPGPRSGIGVWFSFSQAIGHNPDHKFADEVRGWILEPRCASP